MGAGDNQRTALALAAQGIAVFPCKGGEGESDDDAKRPLPNCFWRRESTTDARRIERWWRDHPTAIPAIDLAKSKLIVIDCDRPKVDGADGVEWFAAWSEEHGLDLSAVPATTTLSGGRHLFFRNPDDLGNARGALPPKRACGVDVRGSGGYVIAPGASLPDGRAYVGEGDPSGAPEMPPELASLLRGETGKSVAANEAPEAPAPPVSAVRDDARIASYAEAGVEAELRQVRSAGKGERNNTLNTAAFSLGQMVGAGWIAEADAAAWLEAAAGDCGLVRDDGVRSVRATIRSGLRAGRQVPRSLPAEPENAGAAIAHALIERDGSYFDPETGEEVVAAEPKPVTPVALPSVPGLVGEIADWIVATSRRPQPDLALGAALAVVGTAIGRNIAGPTLSGTHLYVIGLGPTGAGKDHPLQQCGLLLRAAGMAQHIGPSEFISMPAVINFLLRSPLSLCAMDEFGAFIKRINSRRASGFEGAISKILRTAWGVSFKTMTTPEWAGKQSSQIVAPALSIYGVSTEEEFYGSLEGSDQDNGVLNRFLIFRSRVRPAERRPSADPFAVPESIAGRLKRLYTGGSLLHASLRNSTTLDVPPTALGWGAQAEDAYEVFREEIEGRSDADADARPFLARTVEMALRIATIVAAGRFSQTVDLDDMMAGRSLALASAEVVLSGARDHIADTETQAAANRIVRTIRAHGGRMQRQHLLYALRHSMKARDLNPLLDEMIEAETLLSARGETSKTGGRAPTIYVLPNK